MNWTEIRPLNGSQNDGFEELVCQLANKELIPNKKQFIRNGKPDAGVECYCVLNDDKEVAWQAKYFTSSFSATQWAEIDSSVITALDKHTLLTKYIIAFPINPPDARLPRQKSMREKWDEHVSKWKNWAAQKNMSVEFVPWWESDIIERLQLPDNAGLFYFWFHQQEFTSDWFNNINNKSIADLGVRYTPELNVELDIAKIFDGLLRNSRFNDLFYTSLDNLLIACDKVLKSCKDLTTFNESISSNMGKLVNAFDIKNLNHCPLQIPIQQYCNIISDFSDCCDGIMNYYIEEEGKIQKELNEHRFYHKYGSEIHYVRGLQETLYTFSQFINSATCKLANTPILLLEGDAGVGKSHLFADVVKRADGTTAFLLLGQYFTSQDSPWTQIKRICDINCSEDEFWGSLNAKAESEQRRIVLFIDAANEGSGKSFWKNYINGFITTIAKYEWLGLAISVRSTYTKLLFPKDSVNRFIRYKHEGFGEKEGEAIHIYFKAYDIPLPDTPILQTEFQNPLFLKLFCIGQQNNRNRIGVSHINHLDAIIKNYISGIENQLADRLDYNASLQIVEKAINTLIDYMVVNNKTIITYEQAYLELDTICTRYHINNSLLEELISEGIFIKNAYNEIEYVYFAYERLGDYLTAKHLLEKANNIDNAFIEGGELFNYVRDIYACTSNQGLIDAFSILVPTLTGREFFEFIPHVKDYHAIAESFINSMLWRQVEQMSDEVRTYLMSINDRGLHQLFWNTCLSISTIPNHAFNANFLHQHLSKFTLADRDCWWIPFLKFQCLYDSPAKTLINWAWSFEDISHISNESVKLTAITLSWFLASTNRSLRDSSTKALICLLKRRIGVLIDVLRLFENVNDPYIYERLYAVAFGCAVRMDNKKELTELSQYVYETIFKDKEEVYPHILLRDYAREIIEYANYKGCALSAPIEEIRPPYHSTLPKKFPSNEKIDTKYKLDYQAKDFKDYYYSQNSILHSMVTEYGRGTGGYGDFGRYVFQAGLRCFDINYDGLSNYAVRLIFEKYGYDKEKHGKFDRECVSYSWHYHNGGRNERIGKKYQWLAYYELLARVSDNCQKYDDSFSDKIEPYNGPWNPYVRDIDPTILIHNTGSFHVLHPKYWWEISPEINMSEDNKTWMTHKDDLPSPNKLIDISNDNGEEWLALEYHPEWDEEKHLGEEKYDSPKKKIWYQIRSYLVREEDYQKVIEWINGKNFRGRWMPEKTGWYELFNREYYWSPGFREFDKRYIEETESSEEFQLNDNATGLYIANCFVTTKAYFWEEEFDHSKDDSFNINIPSKLIYDKMHLQHSDNEGEFVDAANNLICFDPSVYNNSFSALLIKKQPFLDFLKNNNLKIFWTLLSEKQIIGGGFSANYNPPPLDISGVYYLDDNYRVQGDFAIHSPEELMYKIPENVEDDLYEFDNLEELIRIALQKEDDDK